MDHHNKPQSPSGARQSQNPAAPQQRTRSHANHSSTKHSLHPSRDGQELTVWQLMSSCSATQTMLASSPTSRRRVSRWERTIYYDTGASPSTCRALAVPPVTRSYVTELPVSPSNHNAM